MRERCDKRKSDCSGGRGCKTSGGNRKSDCSGGGRGEDNERLYDIQRGLGAAVDLLPLYLSSIV